MAPFDYDMSQILHKELLDNGVELFLGDGVKAIAEDHVTLVSGREIPADVVVLAIGVMPETALAKRRRTGTGRNRSYQSVGRFLYK